jgi:hypothetical protein
MTTWEYYVRKLECKRTDDLLTMKSALEVVLSERKEREKARAKATNNKEEK